MENLTKKAGKVLEMAANIAWTEKEREVQTRHLLCALAVVDGTAKEILKNNNIREEDMRQIYERCFEEMKKNKKNHASEMPFTPVLQKILQDAETLARYQKQEVGTEHLLMAAVLSILLIPSQRP